MLPAPRPTLFEKHDNDSRTEIWYNDRDYKVMKRANVREAQSAHKILQELATSSDVNSTDSVEELIDPCIMVTAGLENMLTSKILKKTYAVRKIHKKAVLNEQEKQYQAGVSDPDRLASVSCIYSN